LGPHDGHEAELLMAGLKPAGVFAFPLRRKGVEQTFALQERIKQVKADIIALDEYVESSRLCKVSFSTIPEPYKSTTEFHIYAQNHQNHRLSHLTHSILQADRPNAVFYEQGTVLGYTRKDVELFVIGGYDALPFPERVFMKLTHDLRKKMRITALLGDEHAPNR
jgi:hypothetical protein